MAVRVGGEDGAAATPATCAGSSRTASRVARSGRVYPGVFFGSGTVSGGCGLEHMRFLKPGDIVELEVEKIGILRNRVVR